MAATTTPLCVSPLSEAPHHAPPQPTCVKELVESAGLTSIPPNYTYFRDPTESIASEPEDSLPTIDFSSLNSGEPNKRSQVIQQLSKACEDWGFFMVVNHGVPESLMKAVIDGCQEFFNLKEDEKKKYEGNVLDPIRWGTSFNANADSVFFWRDFLKVFVHPKFHFPSKPQGFSELAREYSKQTRRVALELLKGISESLGLEQSYVEKAMNLEEGLQIFVSNLYPPCPQPELAMGMPPHSDHGLLTLLIQNQVGGLQIQHNGKWFNVNALPNSILVNTGDHLEILSNGKYKGVLHRAVVNNKTTRISLVTVKAPALDTVVGPVPKLVDKANPPAFIPMKYRDYLELQQSKTLSGKSALDTVRL